MISAIIPCCNEYPQVLFTVQSILEAGADEVIVVSNMSTDKTNSYFNTLRNPRVKFFIKDDQLSHWQAKNLGIEKAKGDYLFFVDAHCIINNEALSSLIEVCNETAIAHCVLHYMLDGRKLIYKPRFEQFNYRFCNEPNKSEPYKVPVMSTCGMMCSRSVIDKYGGWNKELGIYGGGEAYINWKLSVCGVDHIIQPKARCWHYAEKRGYSWNYLDYMRNEFIAAYCVGGEKWLGKLIEQRKQKGSDPIDETAMDVIAKCKDDREFIEKNQVMTFDEYVDNWEKNHG